MDIENQLKIILATEEPLLLKEAWRNTLTAPQDGMWESFMDSADLWTLKINDSKIGYACVNQQEQLIQFFVTPAWRHKGTAIFETFIRQHSIKKAMVGTNNPVFLFNALHFQASVVINTYFFTEHLEAPNAQKEGVLKEADTKSLNGVVEFCHLSIGAPKEWLNLYLTNLINRRELFILRNEKDIIGTCEVRKSDSNPKVADIGMIVSPYYRKQGYGTYLLGMAKKIAIENGKVPICSCEKTNVGSLKSIHRNGFRSLHSLLEVELQG